jgi:hypothetical protein
MTRTANSASLYLRSNKLYGTFDAILEDGRRAPLPDIFDFGAADLNDFNRLATAARDVLDRSATYTNGDSSLYTPASYDNGARALGFKSSSAFLSEALLISLSTDGESISIYATKRKGKKNPGFLGIQEFVAKRTETAELGAAIKAAFEKSS